MVLLDVFDGILPAQLEVCCRTKEDTLRYEEDRRLYYVAMTRAKRRLVLFDCPALPSVFTQEVLFNLPEARARREQEAQEAARLRNKADKLLASASTTAPAPKLPPVDLGELSRVGATVKTRGVRPGFCHRGEWPLPHHPLSGRPGAPPGRSHGGRAPSAGTCRRFITNRPLLRAAGGCFY